MLLHIYHPSGLVTAPTVKPRVVGYFTANLVPTVGSLKLSTVLSGRIQNIKIL